MTALENVLVGMNCRLKANWVGSLLRPPAVVQEEAKARDRALELLAYVGLRGQDETVAKNLPYGLQRRLEIARALATDPKLLLLDEPLAGLVIRMVSLAGEGGPICQMDCSTTQRPKLTVSRVCSFWLSNVPPAIETIALDG